MSNNMSKESKMFIKSNGDEWKDVDEVCYIVSPDVEALRKENEQLRLAIIKCEQEVDFALKQVSQSKIYAAVTELKRLLKSALKGGEV